VLQPLQVPAEGVGQIIAGQHATVRKQRRLELDHVPIPVLPGVGGPTPSRATAGGAAGSWASHAQAEPLSRCSPVLVGTRSAAAVAAVASRCCSATGEIYQW
jgi:hypothetical protein